MQQPKKDKILQKHEFAGNQNWIMTEPSTSVHKQGEGRGGPGPAAGRGRGGRGARGGGGESRGGRPGDDGTNIARERAWKGKNKASRANHNRKGGHDKKMVRAGAGPSA
jgi:activating signal cointegrator complex subunit 2